MRTLFQAALLCVLASSVLAQEAPYYLEPKAYHKPSGYRSGGENSQAVRISRAKPRYPEFLYSAEVQRATGQKESLSQRLSERNLPPQYQPENIAPPPSVAETRGDTVVVEKPAMPVTEVSQSGQGKMATPVEPAPTPKPREKPKAAAYKQSKGPKLSIGNGYRIDNLDWSTGISLQNPNLFNSLKWRDVESYEVTGQYEYTIPGGTLRNVYLEINGGLGWVMSGRNEESYFDDSPVREVQRYSNTAKEGQTGRLSGAVGYRLEQSLPDSGTVGFTPLVGYSVDALDLRMRDAYLLIPAGGGTEEGQRSSYDAKWYGPYVGFLLDGRFGNHRAGLRSEYHDGNFNAEGGWSLQPNLEHPKSLEQDAEASGYLLALDYGYQYSQHIQIFLQAAYRAWSTNSGVSRFFLADGTNLERRLNDVDWSSQSLQAGVSYQW